MAEHDYGRLWSCRHCTGLFDLTLRKDGSPHKTQPLTCSRGCRERLLRSGQGLGPRACSTNDGRCRHCGAGFSPANAAQSFCTASCKNTHFNAIRARRRAEARSHRRPSKAAVAASLRQARADAALVRAFNRALAAFIRRSAVCTACSGKRDSDRSFLCAGCRRQRAREQKRAEKHVRRARERAAVIERFTSREVFDRDGWRCQICGEPTPERYMGTNHGRAPTLDHVTAIANGGAHAMWNAQCACRRCNSLKSDGPPKGQMGLFMGLAPTGGESLATGIGLS